MTGSVAPLHVWLVGAAGAAKSPVLATVFVHPNNGSGTSNQFIRHHQVSDRLRIAFSDVLALFGTVAFSPSINRLLGAPGRRARRRMVKRGAPAGLTLRCTARPPQGATVGTRRALWGEQGSV